MYFDATFGFLLIQWSKRMMRIVTLRTRVVHGAAAGSAGMQGLSSILDKREGMGMAGLQEYKCPCCGGGIKFDATSQKMKCPYCGTEFETESLAAYDDALQNEAKEDMSWAMEEASWGAEDAAGMKSYHCKSCGAEIMADETLASSKCPYCDNPIVMMNQFSGGLKPNLVIPFKFDKNQAKEALKKHYQGKKLLPRVFSQENHIEEMKGVYVPVWLFNATANASIGYEGTKVRRWSDNRFNYEETSHYAIARQGELGFANVPVDGSTKMDDTMMESIEPFQAEEAVPFQTAFLAGYLADKYDVGKLDSVQRANERIKTSTVEEFRKTVTGYDSVETKSTGIKLHNGEASYALYPVWLLNTKWNGEKYTFAMNGQTGKMVGDLPVDKGLANKYMAISTAIAAVVCVLINLLLSSMSEEQAAPSVMSWVICAIVALCVGFIYTHVLKSEMKSVHANDRAAAYETPGSFKLSRKDDRFLYKNTEKTLKPQNQGQQNGQAPNANQQASQAQPHPQAQPKPPVNSPKPPVNQAGHAGTPKPPVSNQAARHAGIPKPPVHRQTPRNPGNQVGRK